MTALASPARRAVRGLLVAATLACGLVSSSAAPAHAVPAKVNGSGSSYVALAIAQWIADAQTNGLPVNYNPIGSPQGLKMYGQSQVDFTATEAEFTALQSSGGEEQRGYQYVPDVAGATGVLYRVDDKAGRRVDYLHLSPRTIAAIFTGNITRWSDKAISDDNKGLELPDEPITVVYRSGQSGTTGTFYDFIQHIAPDLFNPWAQRNQFPTGSTRIIQLDSSPNFVPKSMAFNGSDQIAQFIADDRGKWSIGYDEFGYAKTYRADAAWVKNASGNWVKPYAQNISAALESARLRPDLSQELADVYTSGNPLAYPISAYSYLVVQCAPAADRPTCKGAYSNAGVTETLQKWMRYIACEGQVNMANIGYAPLPPNLSQEVANAIGRLTGAAPEILTKENCANPRFVSNVVSGPTEADPIKDVKTLAPPAASKKTTVTTRPAANTTSTLAQAGATGPAATGDEAAVGAVGATGGQPAGEGAGSGDGSDLGAVGAAALPGNRTVSSWQTAAPVLYDRPGEPGSPALPAMLLLGVLIVPPLVSRRLTRVRERKP